MTAEENVHKLVTSKCPHTPEFLGERLAIECLECVTSVVTTAIAAEREACIRDIIDQCEHCQDGYVESKRGPWEKCDVCGPAVEAIRARGNDDR